MAITKKGKSGNKKHGRNKKSCEAYRRSGRREINKIKKLKKHLKKFPSDPVATALLKQLK